MITIICITFYFSYLLQQMMYEQLLVTIYIEIDYIKEKYGYM